MIRYLGVAVFSPKSPVDIWSLQPWTPKPGRQRDKGTHVNKATKFCASGYAGYFFGLYNIYIYIIYI